MFPEAVLHKEQERRPKTGHLLHQLRVKVTTFSGEDVLYDVKKRSLIKLVLRCETPYRLIKSRFVTLIMNRIREMDMV